ncbi:unnamed protein product [Adineta ricciae]|uniref:Uncharacterized protein n=1 Tax=Adineta ricciae TaxID=249248 RepID=A0A815JJJ3_ADIRI|nr:unnamed protein product [Adineta ricciae]CAF1483192.1 unnamed protein product [Adineta ricciae]
MPKSSFDFSIKFFHPPHRTVPFHNGLLNTRTKHTVAQDRLVVAERRMLDVERRKSVSNLQTLAFEQKQFEKKRALLQKHHMNSTSFERPPTMRDRSSSDIAFPLIRPSSPLTGSLPNRLSKLSISLNDSKQNLLALPKITVSGRRFSAYSDGDVSENSIFANDGDSGGEEEEHAESIARKTLTINTEEPPRLLLQARKPLPPIVSIIPPEEDVLYLTNTEFLHF